MRAILLPALLSVACYKEVAEAPTEVNELATYLFIDFDGEDEAVLADGVDNVLELHGSSGSAEGWAGALEPLGSEAFEAVGREPDLSTEWLKGVFELVPQQGCSAMDIAAIYAFEDQLLLFPGQYDEYSRTYDQDPACFFDGSCDAISWTAHITDTIGLKQGSYDYRVQLRNLPAEDGSVRILARGWMPEAAEIGADGETDGATFFDQSYTIETFSDHPDVDGLHFYAVWNSGGLKGVDPDADIWEAQYKKGVEDWNDRIDELCGAERSLWE